jgi:uncharacterized membrane protein
MKSGYATIRILLALSWGVVCVLTLAAPLVLARGRAETLPVYLGFSFFCHQLPERSFALAGLPLAVCHRCSGIYLGLFAGALLSPLRFPESLRGRRWWLLAAALPALIDFALGRTGLWPGSAWSRAFSGMFLGYMISPLLVRALAECVQRRPSGALRPGTLEGERS